jgi:hypothetical protein
MSKNEHIAGPLLHLLVALSDKDMSWTSTVFAARLVSKSFRAALDEARKQYKQAPVQLLSYIPIDIYTAGRAYTNCFTVSGCGNMHGDHLAALNVACGPYCVHQEILDHSALTKTKEQYMRTLQNHTNSIFRKGADLHFLYAEHAPTPTTYDQSVYTLDCTGTSQSRGKGYQISQIIPVHVGETDFAGPFCNDSWNLSHFKNNNNNHRYTLHYEAEKGTENIYIHIRGDKDLEDIHQIAKLFWWWAIKYQPFTFFFATGTHVRLGDMPKFVKGTRFIRGTGGDWGVYNVTLGNGSTPPLACIPHRTPSFNSIFAAVPSFFKKNPQCMCGRWCAFEAPFVLTEKMGQAAERLLAEITTEQFTNKLLQRLQ